jgi:uncharacterized membrane protein
MQSGQRAIWTLVTVLAVVQLSVAVFAVYSSGQNILSHGACIGGIFGTLANVIILSVVSIMLLVLGFLSLRAKAAHPWLSPIFILAASSGLSIMIGVQAGLRCTV